MDSREPGRAAGTCPLCTDGPGESAICSNCIGTYGPRVARLLARAERDPDFAHACLRHLPPPLRERFATLLGQRCLLPGSDTRRGPGLRAARPRASAKWLASAN